MSREQSLASRLPGYRLWPGVTARDRVLFVGENDRFHCPAARLERRIPPVAAWGRDPAAWRAGIDALGVTYVLHRTDRRPGGLPAGLEDRLERVGRDGAAVLYRVRPGASGAVESRPQPQ